MSTIPATQRAELDRLQVWSLAVGAVALLVCLIGAPFSPAQFFRAYLAAYQFYLGIALGSFAILMLYHLTGGAWGFLIRRLLEAGMRTLPLLALLFVPLVFGLKELYPWAQPDDVFHNRHPIWLSVPFFLGRTALSFACWILIAYVLSSWSQQQDRTGEPQLPRKFRLLSAPGLVVYGATITFSSIDWIMSLQPPYHSTIFPPVFAAGQLLTAQAFALLVLAWLASRPPLAAVVSPDTLNDLGNLLFTFLVVWAYLVFFEFMLIWMANIPEEVVWYLPRSTGGWQWVAWAIFVFHFALPFFLLLLREIKRNVLALAKVAAVLFFMHLVFLYFQVMPAFPNTSLGQHWMDFLTPLGLGGIWLAYFLWQLKERPVLPSHDPSRQEAVHLRQRDLAEAAREEAAHHG